MVARTSIHRCSRCCLHCRVWGACKQAKYQAWGYPFNYIQPSGRPAAMRQLYPEEKGPISDIPGTGPAPILMRANDWKKASSLHCFGGLVPLALACTASWRHLPAS